MIRPDEYDWRAEDDANTLRRAQEIKSDPERFKKAKEVVVKKIAESKALLKDEPLPTPTPSRKKNPACLGRLDVKY